MSTIPQSLDTALQHHRAGDLQQAEMLYKQILQADPDNPDAIHLLGVIAHQTAKHELAIEHITQAIALNPRGAAFYTNLGTAYQALGNVDEAVDNYHKALRLRPDLPETHNNLANILSDQGRLEDAVTHYDRALQLKPDYAESHNSLGNVLKAQGKFEEAAARHKQALQIDPNLAEAHANLAGIQKEQGKVEEAAASYHQAARLKPEKALWAIRPDTLCPAIPQSNHEIDLARKRIDSALEKYLGTELQIPMADIPSSSCEPSFFLAYHGRNDLPLKSKFACLFARSFAPDKSIPCNSCPHVGFVVTNGHESTFLRFMRGIINRISTSKFKISIICSPSGCTAIRKHIRNTDVEFVTIPLDFRIAVDKLRAARCDILFLFEVGTDSVNYFLPFLKVAPVQCTSWGFPVTSGLPSIDYFISSKLLEPEGAEAHYAERLVQLKTLPTFFPRPSLGQAQKRRGDFGFSEDENLYVCPQSLFKIHPDFDETLENILRQDPSGKVILVSGKHPHWTELLKNRFPATISDVADRICFIPQQSNQDFLSVLAVCDVMLDPFHFGGGGTTYEGLAVGTPIVTMPSEFMRGRVTFGCYKKMGVMDCVATTPQQYVNIAVKIATDSSYRQFIGSKILGANEVLYKDIAAVQELEEFFEHAVEVARAA